jgi:hypothetical protein
MSVAFKKIMDRMRLMNPLKGFSQDEIPLEIRFDPLTGQTGRIFDLPYKPSGYPDPSDIVQRSRGEFCPFCPEAIEKATPLFPKEVIPEGKIRVGEATLVPNLLPLDRYTGVSIMSRDHYVPIEGFTPANMKDAFSAALEFIKRIADVDLYVNFFNINWNYMPQAGSSIVHPHIQVNCGEVPTNHVRIQMEACRKYHEENGGSFWQDYMAAEKGCGERFIGEIGPSFWTMSYVPQSFLPDVWCIFPEHDSLLSFGADELMPFLHGLSRTLKYFYVEKIFSFNMSIFSVRQDDHFRVNARICPRLLLRAIGNSDHTYFQTLHKEPSTVRPPEAVCQKVKEIFQE